jgi:hypothetical protein
VNKIKIESEPDLSYLTTNAIQDSSYITTNIIPARSRIIIDQDDSSRDLSGITSYFSAIHDYLTQAIRYFTSDPYTSRANVRNTVWKLNGVLKPDRFVPFGHKIFAVQWMCVYLLFCTMAGPETNVLWVYQYYFHLHHPQEIYLFWCDQ